MHADHLRHLARLVVGGIVVAGACRAPTEPLTAPAALTARLSAERVMPGATVAVRLGPSPGAQPVSAILGAVTFDPARLRWLGASGAMVQVGAAGAAHGTLRFVALEPAGLAPEQVALHFEAKDADAPRTLRVRVDEIADPAGIERVPGTVRVLPAGGEGALVARTDLATAWAARFDGPRASLLSSVAGAPMVWGDINRTGTVTSGDLVVLSSLLVGTLRPGEHAGGLTGVRLANVTPVNGADGIVRGVGDPCLPGVACSTTAPFQTLGAGTLGSGDLVVLSQLTVGVAHPVAGQPVADSTALGAAPAIPSAEGTAPGTTTVTRLEIRPLAVAVRPGGTQQFCAFVRFGDGRVAQRTPERGLATCDAEYLQYPSTQRTPTAAQQAVADTTCVAWTATAGSITGASCAPARLQS